MCFIVERKNREAKEATKDITCFKLVISSLQKEDYFSLFQGFEYTLNKRYNLSSNLRISIYGTIDDGFHSYSKKLKGDRSPGSILVKCIIPKGATYYYSSKNNEYVSDSIIIKKRIRTLI